MIKNLKKFLIYSLKLILNMTHIKRFNQINESNEENISNDSEIRRTIKYALENMYMFGGMPKPDPKYDLYMNKMIEMIMNSINKNSIKND